jgi:hypothetical protein
VQSQDDVEEAASQIVECFEKIGLPYLEKYSNMVEALGALSGDDPDSWIHSPIDGERAKRAVGLAWLLKDAPKLEELTQSKMEFLTERKYIGLDSFKTFAESLRL